MNMAKTLRKEIIALLQNGEWTAQDISQAVHIPQKDVYDHLEHIQRSLRGSFMIKPAQCLACGFTFTKRRSVRSPSRCPLCKNEHIKEPSYYSTNQRKN
jgi:predicted Zn-ribbon and HTH transcriptional regulator